MIAFERDSYRDLLRRAQAGGFALLPMREAIPASSPVCFLRHDVDFNLHYAAGMAELEHELGARSTYFLIPENPYYDPFSEEGSGFVRRILALGHEIGLHYDSSLYPPDAQGYRRALRADLDRLARLVGEPVRSAAQHKPGENPFVEIGDLVEHDTYGESTRARFDYVSDSSMSWRERTPDQLIAAGADFQFLSHPIWWWAPGDSLEAKLGSLAEFGADPALIQSEIRQTRRVLATRAEYDRAFREKRSLPSR